MKSDFCTNVIKLSTFKISAIALVFSFSGLFSDRCLAQDDAIKAIQDAGGRVSKISAAGPEREINFSLSSKKIDDKVLPHVAKVDKVIWLNLRGTNITNDGLKSIANMKGLTRLHLERSKIGDDGLKHLANLENLVYLNLYATQVTDAGLKHLEGLKNLKKLYVWQSKVSEDGMKQLNTKLPNVEIVGELKLETPKVVEEGKKKGEMKKGDKKKSEKKKDDKKKGDKKKDEKKKKLSP